MVADICLMVSQEVNKIWMFGKKSWPSGLILKPFFTSIVKKMNWSKDSYTEARPVEDQMITNKLSEKGFKSLTIIQSQSLIITPNSIRSAELMLTDQSM